MKNFESVYKTIEELFINELPAYIEKSNKNYNDGIILKPFENTSLKEECIKRPCFKFQMEEAEYSEKDRIIENLIYLISLELKIDFGNQDEFIIQSRYAECVDNMIKDVEDFLDIRITVVKRGKIYIKITV